MKSVFYIQPSSFCFGVQRATDMLQEIINKHPKEQIFCVHELVHNPIVNKTYTDQWVKFVKTIDEIKNKNSIIIFSAHWINREIIIFAKKNYKTVYNLECPLVTKIYNEIDNYLNQWIENFFYIWKVWHQEASNIIDYINFKKANVSIFWEESEIPQIDINSKFAILSQTTLNFEKVNKIIVTIKQKYKNSVSPQISDICKATYERQEVILKNLGKFSAIIVIWGKNSSNTKELVEIWDKNQKKTFFGTNLKEILQYEEEILEHKTVWITWWASTPAHSIREIFDYLWSLWYQKNFINN